MENKNAYLIDVESSDGYDMIELLSEMKAILEGGQDLIELTIDGDSSFWTLAQVNAEMEGMGLC